MANQVSSITLTEIGSVLTPQRFNKIEALAENEGFSICPISLHMIWVPVILNCGHIFGKAMIEKWSGKTCPTCRIPIVSITSDNSLDEKIREFVLKQLTEKEKDELVLLEQKKKGEAAEREKIKKIAGSISHQDLRSVLTPERLEEIKKQYEKETAQGDRPFVCSISNQLMLDPVILDCEHSFQKEAIQKWYPLDPNCPTCSAPIVSRPSNDSLKEKVNEFVLGKLSQLEHCRLLLILMQNKHKAALIEFNKQSEAAFQEAAQKESIPIEPEPASDEEKNKALRFLATMLNVPLNFLQDRSDLIQVKKTVSFKIPYLECSGSFLENIGFEMASFRNDGYYGCHVVYHP